MDSELYFIPILREALQRPELGRALGEAFARIKCLGAQEAYRSGYDNFQQFMEAVSCHHQLARSDSVRELIVELVTNAPGFSAEQLRAARELIASNPEWQSEYEQLRNQFGDEDWQTVSLAIEVYRDGLWVGEMILDEPGDSRSLGQITPGSYLLRLNTGLVIWEGQLTDRDLLWTEAFGRKNLATAAETAEVPGPVTRTIDLLGGEAILRICAGPECGGIKLEWIG